MHNSSRSMMTGRKVVASAVWLLFCLNQTALASPSDGAGAVVSISSSKSDNLIQTHGSGVVVVRGKGKAERQRLKEAKASHVRDILSKRLHSVLSGCRAREFEKWASKQDDLKVISMHGVDEAQLDFDQGDPEGHVASSNGLFPDDAINLAMIPIPDLPSQYRGKPFHLEEGGASIVNLFFRSIRLAFNFTPIASTAWLAYLSSSFREKIWYYWFASSLASSGPAFIKWALTQLHNDAPSHSWKHTKKVMESSLGLPPNTLLAVFDSFDTKPLASGSIAQVHRASLNGTTIVAKVRHPNVAKLIDMDFRLMRMAAVVADCLPSLSWLHVRETVDQFSHTMAAQAHLNVEGHHLEVLNYNFRSWNHVKFPKPVYATSAVIIETFESGQIVTTILDAYDAIASQVALEQGTLTVEEVDEMNDAEESKSHGYQFVPMSVAKFIVSTGLSLYLKMLLVDKQMHADLHPGNIMLDMIRTSAAANVSESSSREVDPSDTKPNDNLRLGITLVDAGMVAQLSPEESTNFVGLLCSIGDGNGKVAAQCALRFSNESPLPEEEQQAFINDMDELFKERCRGYHTNVDVGGILRRILGLIRKHKVRIDANYATLVVNCLCIEGLGRRVCPSYNVLDAAKPLLRSYQGLCYKKDGSLVTKPSSLQKGLVRLSMPLAYLQKNMKDTAFFNRQVKKNKVAMG